jgi:hypothetical protein
VADKEPTKGKANEKLPAEVERALAEARRKARPGKTDKSGRWLALVPVMAGVTAILFMFPRATPPDAIPLPRVDHRVTDHIAIAENNLAAAAASKRMSGDVLAIGSAIRDLNVTEEKGETESQLIEARRRVEMLIGKVIHLPGGDQELVELRATQTRTFLDALSAWEQMDKGEPPDMLECGAGGFVKHAAEAGWVEGRHILLDQTERRVAYKTVWNAQTHLERSTFAMTVDEERALYAFYIQHPRLPEQHRLGLEARRRAATSEVDCKAAQNEEQRQRELWRAEKIKRLGAVDSKYPTQYALGIAYARGNRPDLAVESFTSFIDQHPDGPYALRAKNHLKSALIGVAP